MPIAVHHFIDDRPLIEMAAHWQRAAAATSAYARENRDAGWGLLAKEQQDQSSRFYALARVMMGLKS